jgi:formylglycine-generating enzyme required for sulfatase activity
MMSEAPTFQPLAFRLQPLAFSLWRDSAHFPLMVGLPPGEFSMGESAGDKFANDTERPAHTVRVGSGVALGRFPVLVAEFRQFRPDQFPE